MDRLEMDSILMEKMGYGIHYGKYKADHPHTEELAHFLQGKPEEKKSCAFCGKEFKSNDRRKIYCNDDCKVRAREKRKQDNKRANMKCVVCGKWLEGKRKVYCSDECYYSRYAQNAYQQRHRQKKK